MAGILAPVATQMGLQLLLQPFGNSFGDVACTLVGVLYPAYASFKAVEILRLRNDSSEAGKWLTYWAVCGALATVERLLQKLLPWVPYYSTLKLALLLWLHLPRFEGAQRLSREFVRPALRWAHPHIDALLSALRVTLARPEVVSLAVVAEDALARVPLAEWFVRGPDGRPVRSRRPPRDRGAAFITGR